MACFYFAAIMTSNSFGEIKIDKEHRSERIDPIDAAICSHKIALLDEYKIDLRQSTDNYLKMMGW